MAVFVLDRHSKPLMPCTEKRARLLLERGRARVVRVAPFTIRLIDRLQEESGLQPMRLKLDPGSKTTGIAVTLDGQKGVKAILLAEVKHRTDIKSRLDARRAIRRTRRNRKTRYRKARFLNRNRRNGRLPPSIEARVNQIEQAVRRLTNWMHIQAISMELVLFDMRALENPEISGAEYQQGELMGYEIREYLLLKFDHQCVYCKGKRGDNRLEVEHIVPRSRGGTNRVSNLTIACHTCNQEKDDRTAEEYGHPEVQALAKAPLRGAAAANAARWRLLECLKSFGLPIECGTGGRTKMQRIQHGLPKQHYYDALCVGVNTPDLFVSLSKIVHVFTAKGRGSRNVVNSDKYGFPRGKAKSTKKVFGFQTGDMVRADVPKGKYAGTWIGRVAIRAKGTFVLTIGGQRFDVNRKYCHILQRGDGWQHIQKSASFEMGTSAFLFIPKGIPADK